MSKFNPTTGGGSGVLDRALPDLPTGPQAPAPATPLAPDQPDTVLGGLIAGQDVPPAAAGAAEAGAVLAGGLDLQTENQQAREEQREREQIQPLRQRLADTERVDRWQTQTPKTPKAEVDDGRGGLFARASKFRDDYNSGLAKVSARPTGDAFTALREGGVDAMLETQRAKSPGSFIAAVSQAGAAQHTQDPSAPGGINTVVDDAYLTIGAAVTENAFAELAFGEQDQDIPASLVDEAPGKAPLVSKAQNNKALGDQIHREYMRRKNSEAGLPVDQYQDLSPEEATVVGDAFKEMWAQSMGPDYVTRATDPATQQTYFQLTELGMNTLTKSSQARKRMFPKTNIRPQKTPTQQLKGEQRREVKRVTGKVGTPAGMETLEQAANNLNSVPNVVDRQRMRILFSTVLPALAGREGLDSLGATINNFGADKMAKFVAQEASARKEGDTTYSADENMRALQDSIAQAVRSVAMEKDGANYFTYNIQAFNGRISPQQTFFDATSSKAVRFVTRNATPSKATPNSRVEKNLRQMYAMMLVKGADALLPAGRERELDRNTNQLYKWGQRLEQVLNQSMTDAEVDAVAEAMVQGIPLTDPKFPQVRGFQLDPDADSDLIQAIKSKGEDGPHFIDGLIDFKNYWDNKRAGKPHYSYFNAYMDGKTNGIASNGIQMGSKEVALATGVIRNQNKTLLDDGDIRDQLKKDLLHNLRQNGFDGEIENVAQMHDVAKAVFSYRDLNKATTMTFGYGKELGSFKKDIAETVSFFEQLAREGGTEAAERTWVIDQAFLDEVHRKAATASKRQGARLSDKAFRRLFQNEIVERMLAAEGVVTSGAMFDQPGFEGLRPDYVDADGTKVDIKMVAQGQTDLPFNPVGLAAAEKMTIKPDVIEVWEKIQWPTGDWKVGDKVIVRPVGRVPAEQVYNNIEDAPPGYRPPEYNLTKMWRFNNLQPTPHNSVVDSVKKHGLETFGESLAILDEEFNKKSEDGNGRGHLVETLLNMYNESLAGVLSDDAIDSRALMRSAAILHAIANKLFSIKSYTGFDLNLGGNETLGWDAADKVAYSIKTPGGTEKRTAAIYQTEPTAAAIRWKTDKEGNLQAEPGGDAYGGSLPGPVQSLDAATVALTASGKSWAKLRHASGGNPYLHTIYDAFKVDANGYDVVLDEVNKNWLNASMEWSYLEQTYDATKKAMSDFRDELNALDPNQSIDISMSGPYRMMGYLLEPIGGEDGSFPSRLRNKLEKMLPRKKGESQEEIIWRTTAVTKEIVKAVKAAGFDLNRPEDATVKHLQAFAIALAKELDLSSRMSAMIRKTNHNKAELKKEIHKSGPVYQYYAH